MQAFHELYDAYEEAIFRASQRGDRGRSGGGVGGSNNPSDEQSTTHESDDATSTSTPPRQRQKRTYKTDSEIHKVFFDVCDELDRELDISIQKTWDDAIRKAGSAWTSNNHEQCWEIVKSATLMSEIQKFANVFEISNPALRNFLLARLAKYDADLTSRLHLRKQQRIARINRDWPELAGDLKEWASKDWILLDYEDIAQQVHDPAAAQAVRQWKNEHLQVNVRKMETDQKNSANRIVRVFPDKQKIASILKKTSHK